MVTYQIEVRAAIDAAGAQKCFSIEEMQKALAKQVVKRVKSTMLRAELEQRMLENIALQNDLRGIFRKLLELAQEQQRWKPRPSAGASAKSGSGGRKVERQQQGGNDGAGGWRTGARAQQPTQATRSV